MHMDYIHLDVLKDIYNNLLDMDYQGVLLKILHYIIYQLISNIKLFSLHLYYLRLLFLNYILKVSPYDNTLSIEYLRIIYFIYY